MKSQKAMLTALIEEYDKHSEYVNAKIERGIEEYRKGLFSVRITDCDGETITCDNVHINQKSHEFKFGAPPFVLEQLDSEEKNERYKELFCKIFNYAVMPVYHQDVQPQKGEFRFDKNSGFVWRRPPMDTVVEFCRENDLRLKAHCLAYNSFNPQWLTAVSNRDMNIHIEEYMAKIADRYKKDILDMDVINEMFTIYKNCYSGNGMRNLSVTDEDDHVSKMFAWAKKYFPHTKLFWNEGCFETFASGNYKGRRSTYYMMLKEQLDRGTPIEGIGIQYHMYATPGTDDGELEAYKAICNPLRLFDALDCYGEFNLPVHISEMSVPSYSNDPENELLQGELTKRLYKLFFSRKNVESIVWWNMCDKMAYEYESKFHTGILREDLSLKPVFNVIDELVNHRWRTELYLPSRENEPMEFVGFYGDYEITFNHNGKEYKKTVSLTRENTGFDNRLIAPREVKVIL